VVLVVIQTLFLNSKLFCILLDSGAPNSFISIRSTMQLNIEKIKVETNYRIKLSNDYIVECHISYKLVPITIGGITFPEDLILFDFSDFDIILGMNWICTYGIKTNCENLLIILRGESGRNVFIGKGRKNHLP